MLGVSTMTTDILKMCVPLTSMMIHLTLLSLRHVCVVLMLMVMTACLSCIRGPTHLTSHNAGLTQCRGFCFSGQTALLGFRLFYLELKQQSYLLAKHVAITSLTSLHAQNLESCCATLTASQQNRKLLSC